MTMEPGNGTPSQYCPRIGNSMARAAFVLAICEDYRLKQSEELGGQPLVGWPVD